MRVLLVSEKFFVENGGSYTAVSELCYALNAKAISSKIFHNNSGNLFKLLSCYLVIKKFDIVHIFGIWSPFINAVIYLAKRLKKKIILSPIGYLEPWSLKQSEFKKKIAWFFYQKKFLELCNYIHVTSEQEFFTIKKINLRNIKIILLPHGKFYKDYTDDKILDAKKDKRMLVFSRIHPKKGILELVKAWNVLRPKDWELEITGPISNINYKKEIENEIIKNNLSDKVYFGTPVYDEYSRQLKYKNSDVVILPSKNENFGFSICESMLCSNVVICSSETPWKVINNQQTGFCLPLNNTNNIIFALKKVFNLSKSDLQVMGKKAKEFASSKYDLENIIIYKYIKFYRSLI